jgi:hypothetical protein
MLHYVMLRPEIKDERDLQRITETGPHLDGLEKLPSKSYMLHVPIRGADNNLY